MLLLFRLLWSSLSLFSASISLLVLPFSTVQQAGQQCNKVVPVVTTGAGTELPWLPALSPESLLHSTQNCLLSHLIFLRAQQESHSVRLPEAGVF